MQTIIPKTKKRSAKYGFAFFEGEYLYNFSVTAKIIIVKPKQCIEVFSKGLNIIDKEIGAAGDIDTALTTLIFEDGTYAVIDNSRKAIYGYDQRLEIFGNKGMIQVENNLHNRNILYDAKGIHHALPLDFFMERYAQSYLKEIELFIDALVNNKEMPVGGEDAVKASQIAYAAKISVEEGRPVKISEVITKTMNAIEK